MKYIINLSHRFNKRLKIRKCIYAITLFIFFISCTESKKQDINEELTVIDFETLSQEDLITKNIKNIDFIKLETNDRCLIRGIATLEIDTKNDRIFIFDSNKKIFVFDIDGKFLNTIGSIGTGPNEQLTVVDIFLDKENERIGLVDVYRSSFFYYSYSGKFLKEEKIDDEILALTRQYFLINESTMLLVQENSKRSLFNYRLLDINNDKYKDCLPFLAVGSKCSNLNRPKISNNNSILMSAFLTDTIYEYDKINNTIKSSYFFKTKLGSANKNDFENDYELGGEAYSTADKKGLTRGIRDLLTTQKYIYFSYFMDEEEYIIFYNTDSNIGYCNICDIDNFYSSWFQSVRFSTEDAFVSIISADEILNLNNVYENIYKNSEGVSIDTNEDKLNLLKQKTDIEDNPILVMYKLL